MSLTTLPASHADLLERPLFGHLATVRPDGAPQTSVMWFAWDGARIRFTHRTDRQKYRNVTREPRVSLSVQDPEKPYRFLEVRGAVESIEPDADGAFYVSLQERYGVSFPLYDADTSRRVVVTVRPNSFVPVDGGMTEAERQALTDLLRSLSDAS